MGFFLSSAARGRKGPPPLNWGLGSLEEFERTFRFCGDPLCIATIATDFCKDFMKSNLGNAVGDDDDDDLSRGRGGRERESG